MSFFNPITTWRIPAKAMDESCREMAHDGLNGNEGVMLWLGKRQDGIAAVTHLVALRGPLIIKRPDQLVIPAGLLNDVTDLAVKLGVHLVGQIHSHGSLYGTDLSYADKNLGIRVPFFLSLVAPDFALRPYTTVEDCGVHLFEPKTGWRRMPLAEIKNRIEVTDSEDVGVHIIGRE
jgi:hypothetical protein